MVPVDAGIRVQKGSHDDGRIIRHRETASWDARQIRCHTGCGVERGEAEPLVQRDNVPARREVRELEPGLGENRAQQPNAVGAVVLAHAERRKVAEPARRAVDVTIGVDRDESADNRRPDDELEPVVRRVDVPRRIQQRTPGCVLHPRIQVLVEKPGDRVGILTPDRSNLDLLAIHEPNIRHDLRCAGILLGKEFPVAQGNTERKSSMPSVVIAAHNEENAIGFGLDALLGQRTPTPIEVVVSANGCTDRTVEVATRPGITVVVSPEPGKAAALNAGDQVATGFPRIYLDADIVVPPGGLAAVIERLAGASPPLAVVPRRRLNTAGRPWPVRAYCSINERLPAFRNGLFGRGMIALSAQGRSRFGGFPTMIADDLFIDSLFADEEKAEASDVEVVVQAPFTTRDLVRRLVRVRRGNAELRAAAAAGMIEVRVRAADRWAWLREVVLPDPRLIPAALPYLSITLIASLLARRRPATGHGWGRDESTRGTGLSGANGAPT